MPKKVTLLAPEGGWTAERLIAELQKLPPGHKVGVYAMDCVSSTFWVTLHSNGHPDADDDEPVILLY